jgi:cell division septation protein DedD
VRATPRPRDGARTGTATGPSNGVGGFTIQVGAFKERKAAESMAARLKARGFPAYVVSPAGAPNGLFNVRVGSYPARADAERVQVRLRDHEKFRPFIVKN